MKFGIWEWCKKASQQSEQISFFFFQLSFYLVNIRATTSACEKFCKIKKLYLLHILAKKNTQISGCKILHLCTSATVTVHIYTVTVACVFNILHFFFSPSLHSLSFSLSPLSHRSVQPHPQPTDDFTKHRYPTYGDHRKSSELSRTTMHETHDAREVESTMHGGGSLRSTGKP